MISAFDFSNPSIPPGNIPPLKTLAQRHPSSSSILRAHSLPTPSPSPCPSFTTTTTSSSAHSSPLFNMLALSGSHTHTRSFSPFAPAFTPTQAYPHPHPHSSTHMPIPIGFEPELGLGLAAVNSACAARSGSPYDFQGAASASVHPNSESYSKFDRGFDMHMAAAGTGSTRKAPSFMNPASAYAYGQRQSMMRYPPSPTLTAETEAEGELFFPDALNEGDFDFNGLGLRYAPTTMKRPARPAFTLSTNPLNGSGRSGFRQGDWICSCTAHNFGRNVSCIQCTAPRPTNGAFFNACANAQNARGASYAPTISRNASPRFASQMSSQAQPHAHAQHAQQQQQQQQQRHHQQEQQQQQQQFANTQAQSHPLLTPSGRAFAVGGKVQNISPDPLAPCIMFWPENEAFPDPGQIRPASLANVHQPPIMNTGNKGPIEHQPGDWVCRKCEYLNWRRRKVCQTCFPYAEGNGDTVSASMHAERLALLAAVYGQSHPQITNAQAQAASQYPQRTPNAQQQQQQQQQYQFPVVSSQQTSPASSSSSFSNSNSNSGSGYPYAAATSSSAHTHTNRSHFAIAPTPARRTPIPGLSVSTTMMNPRAAAAAGNGNGNGNGYPQYAAARRAASTPEIGSGNIVYQTPTSPAASRPPTLSLSLSTPHARSPTRLLPSFLKHEVQPLPQPLCTGGGGAGFRGAGAYAYAYGAPAPSAASASASSPTSLSLSPASSTSADLPFDSSPHQHPRHNDAHAHARPGHVGVIGSGRTAGAAGFYGLPRGAGSGSGSGSSMGSMSGSASSLTLAGAGAGAGASIWSFERDEDEDRAWSGAFGGVEALKGLVI